MKNARWHEFLVDSTLCAFLAFSSNYGLTFIVVANVDGVDHIAAALWYRLERAKMVCWTFWPFKLRFAAIPPEVTPASVLIVAACRKHVAVCVTGRYVDLLGQHLLQHVTHPSFRLADTPRGPSSVGVKPSQIVD